MKQFTLGFKAFDAHELLCHFVAEYSGLYAAGNFSIELRDITFIPAVELPDHVMQASCGAALTSALQGLPQKILLVAVDRPMFWIWSRDPLEGLADLATLRLATFPPASPPQALANLVLARAGVDPEGEIQLLPARDDVARLGLLRSDSVDAAVISSAVPPARMAQLGYHKLCFIGDELRLPTTGLAAHQALLDRAPGAVETLAWIQLQALNMIRQEPDLVATVLREVFSIGADIAHATAKLYAGAFTEDGRTSAEIAQGAIDGLCQALDIEPRADWRDIYLFEETESE